MAELIARCPPPSTVAASLDACATRYVPLVRTIPDFDGFATSKRPVRH
ncbi:MAG TPA: hypothetical protein VGN93_11185 [Shinella sp.]|nr:hypothetical protein [Shinella sp.]MDX3975528.1 hypothetical protein [Shinella sp.]HEV7247540.1 hypothetical protein [Shinella sp.]